MSATVLDLVPGWRSEDETDRPRPIALSRWEEEEEDEDEESYLNHKRCVAAITASAAAVTTSISLGC